MTAQIAVCCAKLAPGPGAGLDGISIVPTLLGQGKQRQHDFLYWEFAERDPEDDTVRSASYQTASVYGTGHTGYYANAVKVMRGEAEPETDGREGLRSLELLIALYHSARDGRRVSLPLEY